MKLNSILKKMLVISVLALAMVFISKVSYALTSSHGITSTILIFTACSLTIYYIFRLNISSRIKLVLLLSLVIRTALVFFDIYGRDVFMLPNSGFDSESFDRAATSLPLSELSGYGAVLNVIYNIFGHERLFAQFLNVLFMIFAMIVSLRIMDRLDIPIRLQRIGILIFALLPSNIIISAILLREPLIVLLSAASLYFFIEYAKAKKKSTSSLILAFLLVFAAAYLHSAMIVQLIPYLIYVVFYGSGDKARVNALSIIKLIIYVGIILGIYLTIGRGSLGYFEAISNTEDISSQMEGRVDGGSSYLGFTSSASSPWQILLYAPLKFIYFFGSPMPWNWRSGVDIMTFVLGSVVYVYIIVKILSYKNKSALLKILTMSIVLLGLIHAVGVFNSGTAMRHREKLMAVMVVGYVLLRKEKGESGYEGLNNHSRV